jgi:hydroxymethylpyrimidine/phosphomethylpyrimidine kinase
VSDDRQQVLAALTEAVRRLEACPEFAPLVPEVRSNFAYALPGPRTPEDVAAVDGRITVVAGMPKAAGPVQFGASDHLARLLIELGRHDRAIRAGLNFRWNETILAVVEKYCREQGLAIGAIDRAREPEELIGRDQSSMPWKVARLVDSACGRSAGDRVPPVFYENRGWGKEPLFVLVGPDPLPLADRMVAIARRVSAGRNA